MGSSIANIFGWVFVFQYFFIQTGALAKALVGTALMYSLAQAIMMLLTPFAAAHLRRGVKRSIVYGALLAGAAYVYLGATLEGTFRGEPVGWGIAVFAMLLGASRSLYWVPYQLRATSDRNDRSRMPLVHEAVIALMPIFAGITLMTIPFGAERILFGAAVFVAISLFPLISLQDVSEGFSWKYGDTFRRLFASRNERLLAVSFTQGVQGVSLFLLWPIAVLLVVGLSYQTLGVVMSATLFAVLAVRAVYRRFVKSAGVEHSGTMHAVLSVSGWVLRIFAGTPFAVFFIDSYSYISAPARTHGIDVFAYEQAADQGSFVDEYTTLKEMGLALGRIGGCLIFGLFLLWVPISYAFGGAFLLAAAASAVSVIIERSAAPAVY